MELLHLRESDAEPTVQGRTLTVRLCTYDKIYTPERGKRERVRAGSWKAPLARPSGLVRFRHVGERPGDLDDPQYIYGPVTVLREVDGTIVAEGDIVTGDRGDHLLALVESKALRGASMSAVVSGSQVTRDGIRDITRIAAFNGFSLTPKPGYDDAEVLALRETMRVPDVEKLQRARAEAVAIRAQLTRDMARWGKPGK